MGARRWEARNFELVFHSPALHFRFSFLSLWGSSRVFFFSLSGGSFRDFFLSLSLFLWGSSRGILVGGFEGRDPRMCTFGLSGSRVKPRRPAGRREKKKAKTGAGEGKNSAKFWAVRRRRVWWQGGLAEGGRKKEKKRIQKERKRTRKRKKEKYNYTHNYNYNYNYFLCRYTPTQHTHNAHTYKKENLPKSGLAREGLA